MQVTLKGLCFQSNSLLYPSKTARFTARRKSGAFRKTVVANLNDGFEAYSSVLVLFISPLRQLYNFVSLSLELRSVLDEV